MVRNLSEPKILVPTKYTDNRGNLEITNYSGFLDNRIDQEIISTSHKNVFRGFHLQRRPSQQIKLVRVVKGSILDIVININSESKNFLKIFQFKLDDKDSKTLYVPEGFCHGFLSLSEETIVRYNVSGQYSPDHEVSINPFSKIFSLNQIIPTNVILSEKDSNGFMIENVSEIAQLVNY